jgi:hypothetical protein
VKEGGEGKEGVGARFPTGFHFDWEGREGKEERRKEGREDGEGRKE